MTNLALPRYDLWKAEIGAFPARLTQREEMAWAKPLFGPGRVDAAGKALLKPIQGMSEFEDVLSIINNWRSSHSFPLQSLTMTLRGRAKRIYPAAIVAQRLKRLSSIQFKLARNKAMKLSQMQDIGGCRAVMRTVAEVDKLLKSYETSRAKNPKSRAEFIRKYDYIQNPKTDGYRSVHLVYKYRSGSRKSRVYNGMRIEIQVRSHLQHAWATAVETVSIFTDQALKYSIGEKDWKNFFILMGSAIAVREKGPVVPGTPTDPLELKRQLRELSGKLNAESALEGWGRAVQELEGAVKGAVAYLLLLDPVAKMIRVTPYQKHEIQKAAADYLSEEKQLPKSPAGSQVVLVSVDSITALRRAYPNYYLDTTAFVEALRYALE